MRKDPQECLDMGENSLVINHRDGTKPDKEQLGENQNHVLPKKKKKGKRSIGFKSMLSLHRGAERGIVDLGTCQRIETEMYIFKAYLVYYPT